MTDHDDGQSAIWGNRNTVDDIGDFLGGDVARDVVKVALAFQDADLSVDAWNAGVLPVDQDDVAREVTAWSAGTLDVEARNAFAFEHGTDVGTDGSTEQSLAAPGADDVVLRVERASTSYDVEIDWQTSDGTVLWTESVASAVGGGTETKETIPASSPYATVRVADAGGGSGAVTATYHMR